MDAPTMLVASLLVGALVLMQLSLLRFRDIVRSRLLPAAVVVPVSPGEAGHPEPEE